MKWRALLLVVVILLSSITTNKVEGRGMFGEITSIDLTELSEEQRSEVTSVKVWVERATLPKNTPEEVFVFIFEATCKRHRVYPFTGWDKDRIYFRLIGKFEDLHAALKEIDGS